MSGITDMKPESEPTKPSPPTITSKNLPTPPVQARPVAPVTQPALQATVDSDEPIVAKPLIDPDFTNLKKKNTMISLRWVNRVAGDGMRYEHMKAIGFANATANDVEVPPNMLRDGAIIIGDLILMKIARRDYEGALLHNVEKAVARTRPRAYLSTGKQEMTNALNEVRGTAENKRKIQPFVPGRVESLENEQ